MEPSVLQEMLGEAARSKGKDGSFAFKEGDQVSLMMTTGGSLFTIDGVRTVELRTGYLLLTLKQDELYLVPVERVAGFKVTRAKRDGAGFLG